jgi:hypothetical protein
MSVDQATSALLSPEEKRALLPLRAKWEKELASLEQQLTALTSRKSELTRMLASLNGIIPPEDDGQSAAAGAPVPRGPAPGTAPALNPITEQHNVVRGRKKFAAVAAYWLPTLQALAELGGKARRDEVVELVGKKMQGVLTPEDQELLPSGIEVRWKNRVAWQRENMKRLGLLRDDSPQGIWEITDTGRQWLLDLSSRVFFYTLAALRIGNLSGDRAHPVTMGGYRNFVRQHAQEFGDATLGEADDHVLTDPMVLLWKQGCMELNKYDPTKNEWWKFAELQDIRLLVGRGDWTIKLTPEGRALLAKLEDQAKLVNKRNAVGFHT